ncbi:hypothetical protein SM933_02750, partial [Escherichia coli]|nr:hypothetical protein [Escherichia coli]
SDKSYFISLRHIWRASNNATQRASADAGAFDGVLFFTGRWWPFFYLQEKKVCLNPYPVPARRLRSEGRRYS